MKTTYGLPQKRELVLEALKAAFVNNNLDESEYESRVNQTLEAKYVEELRAVLYDFPKKIKEEIFDDIPSTAINESNLRETSNNLSNFSGNMPTESERYTAFFSEKRQDIAFMNNVLAFQSFMSEHNVDMRKCIIRGDELFFNISCHAGSMTLDLRNENLDGKKINIKVDCIFGQIKVYVPAGGKIVNNASMILGDFSLRNKKKSWLNKLIGREDAPAQEANFTLVIHGNCAFAEFVVVY
jgi:hypothetical protein